MAREGIWMVGAGPAGFARGIWGVGGLVGLGVGFFCFTFLSLEQKMPQHLVGEGFERCW